MTERKFGPAEAETLDVLNGSRRKGAIDKAAVRIEDLAAMLGIADLPVENAAGGTPTAAEFNQLAAALRDTRERLGLVAETLNRRRR